MARMTLLRRFSLNRRGIAAVEMALITPVLLLLALACYEVPRLVILSQKMTRGVATAADLVAQADNPITGNQICDIFQGVTALMQPYPLQTQGRIIVSSINRANNVSTITWQRAQGTLASSPSKIGAQGSNSPVLPTGGTNPMTLGNGDNVLVAEIYFRYQPFFNTVLYDPMTLYYRTFTRPRNNNLIGVPSAPSGTGSCTLLNA